MRKPGPAARLLLRSLFSHDELASSNIKGDPSRGINKLDPKRITAIREWAVRNYPNFHLHEKAKDWRACVSMMTKSLKYIRLTAKKLKDQQECSGEETKHAAEIDVELSDSEGDGPSTSRKGVDASGQQRASESLLKSGSEETIPCDPDFEYLGPPSRQVKVPQVAMQTARLRGRPELVARFLIKVLFPENVLVKSNVYGNSEHGIKSLDRNKISALREHLKERFPWLLLDEDGQDWKACVGAINSTIRKFRHEQKKRKTRRKGK